MEQLLEDERDITASKQAKLTALEQLLVKTQEDLQKVNKDLNTARLELCESNMRAAAFSEELEHQRTKYHYECSSDGRNEFLAQYASNGDQS